MDFIWIIVGVVYVVYKLMTEEFKPTWKGFLSLCLALFPLFIGNIIISVSLRYSSVIGTVIGVLVLIGWIIGLFVWSNYSKETPITQLYQPSHDISDIQKRFLECGYNNISQKEFDNLVNNPFSPINGGSRPKVLISECYKWMCDQATWAIDKLSRIELSEKLGVPLDKIPLDKTLPIGEASLKRTTLAKNYILNKDGLRYRKFPKYLESSEYSTLFVNFVNDYISEHQ